MKKNKANNNFSRNKNNNFIIASIVIFFSLIYLLSLNFIYGKILENKTINDVEKKEKIVEINDEKENNEKQENNNIENICSGTYKTNGDDFFEIMKKIFYNSADKNDYYYFKGYNTRLPYIQVAYFSNKKYDSLTEEIESNIIKENIVNDLKKCKFKITTYEYINVQFSGYDSYGKFQLNGGPFYQIRINHY